MMIRFRSSLPCIATRRHFDQKLDLTESSKSSTLLLVDPHITYRVPRGGAAAAADATHLSCRCRRSW